MTRSGRTLDWALVFSLAALGRAGAAEPASRPNVVLVSIDTLRADRLGTYGARTGLTPRLDALARESVVYENATAPMPLTRPSHFSMLTGLYPREHGVLNNQTPLPADVPTIAEAFHRAGYRTGGFVAVSLLAPDSGVARGFDDFTHPTDDHGWSADRVLPSFVEFLERDSAAASPFFAWIHLFDPHMPYEPPAGYRTASTGEPRLTALFSWPLAREIAAAHGGSLSSGVLRRAQQLYDGEVRFADHAVGEVLDAIAKRGLAKRTLVIVTADHGECFDHGVYFEHSDCLFDGAVRVPLLVRDPGRERGGERVPAPIGLAAVAPLTVKLAGVAATGRLAATDSPAAAATDAADGIDGFEVIEGPSYPAAAQARRTARQREIRMVAGHPTSEPLPGDGPVSIRTRRWKLIAKGASSELYDLTVDPAEARDVASRQPETVSRLRARLAEWSGSHPRRAVPTPVPSAELEEALRALGYVP